MSDRLHQSCRGCSTTLDPAVAHCTSRTCPWCRACASKKATR